MVRADSRMSTGGMSDGGGRADSRLSMGSRHVESPWAAGPRSPSPSQRPASPSTSLPNRSAVAGRRSPGRAAVPQSVMQLRHAHIKHSVVALHELQDKAAHIMRHMSAHVPAALSGVGDVDPSHFSTPQEERHGVLESAAARLWGALEQVVASSQVAAAAAHGFETELKHSMSERCPPPIRGLMHLAGTPAE